FLGPTTIYSHLQACGIINDHAKDCPCYAAINAANPTIRKRADAEVGVAYFGD
ncbi:MAG: DNA-3-methyladenine glycosylase I, partial [Victivallales bacterium]|nr:DNA-3-methyladenine glycosylase I [Victivallales bacterium]